jgi:hypothetical protein
MGGGPIMVTNASLASARSVALTTGSQVGGTTYNITVDSSLTDLRGTGVPSTANTTSFTGAAGAVCMPGVVISALYTAGGNSGATYNQKFAELHNRTSAPVSLAGWSIQYTAGTTTGTWTSVAALSGTIPADGYFLVGLTTGGNGAALPTTPDVNVTLAPAAANGRVALVSATAALSGCPTGAPVVDLVGYGTSNCFEGTAAVGALSTTTWATRNGAGCTDTNVNSVDLAVSTVAAPRNSMTAANACTCP